MLRLSDEHPQFYNRHKQKGWCDEYPVYALCFELATSARIKRSTENIRLVKLFLRHYWNNEDRIDAEFTKTSSKLKESAGALRLLLQNDNEFDSALFVRSELAQVIGQRLEEYLGDTDNLQSKTQNYITPARALLSVGLEKDGKPKNAATQKGEVLVNEILI